MSLFSGGKSKDKDPSTKKSQFYVEFLGWMECRGLRGEGYTEPVIRELRRRHKNSDALPKLTIQVSRKNLQITQEVEEKKKRGIKKIKFPTIPARDVTFVHHATRPGDGRLDDIVACIYLGYMPRTQRYVHVHVYRFDEASTASLFVRQMSPIVESNLEHIREVEIDLANKGEVDDPSLMPSEELNEAHTTDSAVGSTSSAYSDEESRNFGSDEIDPDLQSLIDIQPFDSVADELKHRLQMADAPLLLPPKDYDTISRAHGNLAQINQRRCVNLNIVGLNALPRERNGSNESGVDISSPRSDSAETDEKRSDLTKLKLVEDKNSPSVSPKPRPKSLPIKETKNSPQIHHKPTHLYETKLSPHVAHKTGFPDSPIPSIGLNSGNASPEILLSAGGFIYPPKTASSPASPRIFRQPHVNALSRQGSQNSFNSESSKLSHRSDEGRSGTPIQRYAYGSNDDIYAVPSKATKKVPPADELPPDYQDDDDLPGINQLYLTRSLPADLIRDKLNKGSNSRPSSGEIRLGRRVDSPVFMKAPQPQGSGSKYSPHIQRNAPSNR